MIGNKIADKITSVSKKFTKELPNDETEVDIEIATPKKRYIYLEERQQMIDELMLVPKKDVLIKASIKKEKIHISRGKTTSYWWIKVSITI